jgi:DNA-binding protein H-NS
MDFTNLSYQELKETRDAIDVHMQQRREEALAEFRQKAAKMDFDATSIFDAMDGKKAKYSDGQGNVWSGKGRKPTWLIQALDNGASLEDFRAA